MAESEEFLVAGTDSDRDAHEPLLQDRVARAVLRQRAVQRAIQRGVPESLAIKLYGASDPSDA